MNIVGAYLAIRMYCTAYDTYGKCREFHKGSVNWENTIHFYSGANGSHGHVIGKRLECKCNKTEEAEDPIERLRRLVR